MRRVFWLVAGLAVLPVSLLGLSYGADEKSAALRVMLSLGKMGTVDAVYQNGSKDDVKEDKQVILNSILALEVRDGSGKVLPPVPPTVLRNPEYVVIPAGKEISVSYNMDIFSPPLTPGTYSVRVRLPDWKSNELRYTVRKAHD